MLADIDDNSSHLQPMVSHTRQDEGVNIDHSAEPSPKTAAAHDVEDNPIAASAPQPQIIILNGVGSVGKTSTARALQAIAAAPFMHVSMDAFLDMLPAKLFGQPDGLTFTTIDDGGKPSIAITSGPVIERALRGMRHAVAALAEQGNPLIVDEVMIGDDGAAGAYRTLLAAFDLRFVGLFAPLEVLEARELARGDREIGLARWQYDRVHQGMAYDLEIDTSKVTPEDVAARIRDAFDL
jgi:chloramphenicol 3-O phosphotransferase